MSQPLRKNNYMRASLRGPGSARTVLLRMAADQERADRIRALKADHPTLTWRVIAESIGVTERAAAEWARSGGIAADNAEKLAQVFQKAGAAVDFDWIWHGPREETPSPFAQRDQVNDVREEFRADIDDLRERQERIERKIDIILHALALIPAPPEATERSVPSLLDALPEEWRPAA